MTNNVALTPPMGWNDYNSYGDYIYQAAITNTINIVATNGMKAAGYQYIGIDDGWSNSRNSNGVIMAYPGAFPNGIAWLANYAHTNGLKLGVYTDHGTESCAGNTGSYGHEYADALTFGAWGVDYLKEDNCYVPANAVAEVDYGKMSDGLMKSGQPIVLCLCGGASLNNKSYESWSPVLGNTWRSTLDINDSYSAMISHLDPNSATAFAAGPGRWNDPDMLEVGNGGMTATQDQAHFTMWCIMAAPLIMGNNLTTMSAQALATLTNPEAIAVDQDPAGEEGVKIMNISNSTSTTEVWSKTLGYDFSTKAVVLFNRLGPATNITVNWTNIGLQAGTATVRDLWAHVNLGTFTNSFTTNVGINTAVMLEIVGTPPVLPGLGSNYLTDLQAVYAYTGSGAIVKDKSIGGNTVTLNGVTYPKGIGVNSFAGSDYDLGGVCSRFQATIGVDDEVGSSNGSVIFQVFADGQQIYNSGVMISGAPSQAINLDVTGVRRLILGVGDADDNINNDHADWANALVVVSNTTPQLPYAPTGLVASPGNAITLTWNPALAANTYNVQRSIHSGGPYTLITNVPITTFTDNSVAGGITYYYVVSSVNITGQGSNSLEASATTCNLPAVPANVVTAAGPSSTVVTWNASVGATSYNIERFNPSTAPVLIASGVTATNYTDTTVTPGQTNYYLVAAVNACNQSSYSAFAAVGTPFSPPAAPTNLIATPGNEQVSLSWAASFGATSYNVERSTTNGGPYVTIQSDLTTNYLDTAVSDGTTYYYVVSAVVSGSAGPYSTQVSATPNIAPGAPPLLLTQPASQTNYINQTATLSATATSVPPLYYQWCAGATGSGVYTNLIAGGQFSTVTNSTLIIPNLAMGNAADYIVVVTNSNGSTTSAVATLTVLNTAPSIVTQPAGQTDYIGQTATLSVTAAGLPPLYYQWQAGAVGSGVYTNLIAGGQFSDVTNATLTITSVAQANTADYVVVVTNASGSVTSAVATLTVSPAPFIITAPASQTNYVSLAATFTVTAAGLPPLSYQWQAGTTGSGIYTNLTAGGQFSAVTNSILTISNLTLGNALDYVVVVTNLIGSVTSVPATLTLLSSPVVTYQGVILNDHPISFWPFKETNGTVIHDIAGANNGTAMNTTGLTFGSPGVLYSNGVAADTGIYFNDANSGYITVPYSSTLNTPQFTVEVWLEMPAFPDSNAGADMNPLSFDNANSPLGWVFEIPSPNGSNPQIDGWLASGGWTQIGGGKCIQNNWTYYNLTYNGTTFSIYTNGVLVNSSSSSYSQVSSGHALFFGAYDDSGGADRFYLGGMENVAVYSNALTLSQITNHYHYGTSFSSPSNIAPSIVTQPASQTNYATQTASFTVSAGGNAPLSYQWRVASNGVYASLNAGGQFSGATNATLTISNLVLSNATNYEVVVANPYGSITSAVVTLTVLNGTPVITTQPLSQTNSTSQTATFTVTASGLSPLSYQWQEGTVGSGGPYTNLAVGGQFSAVTNSTLSISNLAATNTAAYVVVVANAYGSVTSAVAALTVLGPPPSITTQPLSQTNYASQSITFSVTATSVPPLYYQWRSGVIGSGVYTNLIAGGQFSAVTNSTLTISNLVAGNAAAYEVVVTNSNGSVTSAVATLTVLNGTPSITTQPASQTNYIGQTNTFTVTAAGPSSLSYQWRVETNGVYANLNAGGQFSAVTNATLAITGLAPGNATNYQVVVANAYGSITSAAAALTLLVAVPSITTQPASQTNLAGQTVTFTVTAAGLAPLYYQWKAGATGSGGPYTSLVAGGQFSAVTNATLTISNLVATNAADYVVVVANASGSVTSAVARLTVQTNSNSSYKPTILADHPVSYWPLNETTGAVIHDVVGTNNGTCMNTNGLTLGGPGILYSNGVTTDTAIYFNDANDGYINVPYSSTLNTPQFSMEVWLKMPVFPDSNAGYNMNPVSFDNGPSPQGWAFEIPNPNASNPQMDGWLADNAWTQISGGTCIQSKWAYYALTYNGTTFAIYTNGMMAGSSSANYVQVNPGLPLLMGGYGDGGIVDRFYLGGMENVAVYSNALSASHILTHYQAGTNAVLAAPPTMSIQKSGSNIIVSWTSGFLQKAANLTGPWSDVLPTNETSPQMIETTNAQLFFRASSQP